MTLARSLTAEITTAMDSVRAAPEAVAPRMALFQLACVVGDWKRARMQLETMAKLDEECALLSRTYTRLIDAEPVRNRVFSGDEQPVALGEPPPWLAMMARALLLDREGDAAAAHTLRQVAREATAARSGRLDEELFAWLMDADPRLGATLEIIVEGQYRWLPLQHLIELRAKQPSSVRDIVWQPVTLTLTAGAEIAGFVPARYPGSETHAEDTIRTGNETRWVDQGEAQFGLGQRLFATDQSDHALLDIRRLRFDETGPNGDG